MGIGLGVALAVAAGTWLVCKRMRATALVKTHLINADGAHQPKAAPPRQGVRAGAGTQPAPGKGPPVQMADRITVGNKGFTELTSQI